MSAQPVLLPFPGPASAPAGRRPYLQTVADVIAVYLPHAELRSCADVNADRRRVLADFAAQLGQRPVAECIPFDLEHWLESHARWRSAWTRKRNVSYVQACFGWADGKGLIERNPFGKLRLPEGPRGRPVEDREWATLARASDALFRRVLMFQRYTGARPDEMSRLTWAKIHWDAGEIVDPKHKGRNLQRKPRDRVITLHPVVVRLLRWLRRNALPGQEVVFVNAHGRPWKRRALCQRLARLRLKTGLPSDCKLYGLRHEYVTQGLFNGTPLPVMAELVGHGSTAMTEHYSHVATRRSALGAVVLKAVGLLRPPRLQE